MRNQTPSFRGSRQGLLLQDAKVRLSLRAVVEAEDALDDPFEFSRHMHGPGAPALGASSKFIFGEIDAKCFTEGGDCA